MNSTAKERPNERPQTAQAQAFYADTFPHVDAVYTDAFCLTGSREDAADLVWEAYVRAFRGYEQFRRQQAQGTLAWLYENLHAVFCEAVLARYAQARPLIGE